MSAFANCGRAVAHVQGSYVPEAGVQPGDSLPRRWIILSACGSRGKYQTVGTTSAEAGGP